MASLVLNGNTSGSVTISSPAVSGTTTLTLPTTTGTLVVTSGAQTIEFADGSASTPSITNSGDTNTGIFFPAADTIAFAEGGTESMRINSSGNLQVGTTSGGSERLYVTQSVDSSTAYFLNNNGTTATQYGIVVKLNGDPNNTNHMVQCIGNTTVRAEIRANGGIANYSANNVNLSDQREKTNVELASSYLDKICAIPVKTFNYIDQNMEEDGGLTLGVIAQDVQAVAPELIMESNWAGKNEPEKLRLSIYQTDLQYALMKCIQEQQTIINDLKARIETLEAK